MPSSSQDLTPYPKIVEIPVVFTKFFSFFKQHNGSTVRSSQKVIFQNFRKYNFTQWNDMKLPKMNALNILLNMPSKEGISY